jgi:RNA recognition motif-containing protein
MSYKISVNITVKPKRRSIYVGGISTLSTRAHIRDTIERIVGAYGEIEDIRIPVNLRTGHPLGYAFVILSRGSDATTFMKDVEDHENNPLSCLGGTNVQVSYAKMNI